MSQPDVGSRVADALDTAVEEVSALEGGEVGAVFRTTLADGHTVVAKTGPTPLGVEAEMLAFLGDRGLPVPEVVHGSDDLLVVEYVAGDGDLTADAERDAARHLAALHEESPRKERRAYGFPFDTLDGPYRQPNPWTESWAAFYRDHRLLSVAAKARAAGALSADLFARVESLAADLESLLPSSPPASLLHGDVWDENLVVRDGEVRAFLDPACYFGHAEVELAYVDFAGSFGDVFFDAYEAARGIDAGFFEGRREVYQLYPVLVHLLYFGDDRYANRLRETLEALGR
ncbi:fructosamine kinase family protein [Halorussus marinus]|uniref:fructosamine kinase family protein n=1 Tax=Halorussus marinus TaxID=2505976 RepID=UPI0010925834|nr:fructosamine kinase family protein [Halorussus marinus]